MESASAPELRAVGDEDDIDEKFGQTGISEETTAEGTASHRPKIVRSKMNKSPGPGDYMWNDHVNLKKKPVWSMTSPERNQLDYMLCTWTPAPTSLQPRSPPPDEYPVEGKLGGKSVGRNGKILPPQWSWEKYSGRPCMAPDPPPRMEVHRNLPAMISASNPARSLPPRWSVYGKDRAQLPADLPTWTPRPNTDVRPGPGTYSLKSFSSPAFKIKTRTACTFGGPRAPSSGSSLHPEQRAWIPQTRGSRMCRGEHSRLGPKPRFEKGDRIQP